MISLPQMACRGLGLQPLSPADIDPSPSVRVIASPKECRCSFCGASVEKGEVGLHYPLKGASSFMDDFALSTPGEHWACSWCAPLLKKKPMQTLMNSVVTTDGVYPVSKIENRKYFLLNLPEPPWAMLISSSKMDHLVWKAIPTIDNSLIQVFHTCEKMVIRGKFIPRIIHSCKELTARMNEHRTQGKKKPPYSLNNPFAYLGNKRDHTGHGILRPLVYEIPGIEDLVREMENLTHGEIWLLASVLGDLEPVRPEKIIL